MKKKLDFLKKTKVQKLIIVIIAFLIVGVYITINFEGLFGNFTIETQELENCNIEEVTKYYTNGDITIYLSCLKSVKLNDGIRHIELKDYLSESPNKFEKRMERVLSALYKSATFFDGGTMTYAESRVDNRTNNGITIAQCHTFGGNRDIYIGKRKQSLYEFCKDE